MGDYRRPSRKPIPGAILSRITKLFVSNLPDRCSGSDLAGVLRGYGDIYDIYIANKRDRGGKRFGFVSFLDVKHSEELLNNLKNLRLGDYKLTFNVAKFVFEEGEIRDPPHPRKPAMAKEMHGSSQSNGIPKTRFEKTGTFSFKEALTGVRNDNAVSSKVLRVEDKQPCFNDLYGRSLLIQVSNVDMISRIKVELANMKLGEGVIKYLGGMNFIVTFKSTEHATMAMDELIGRSEDFPSVQVWNGQEVEFERIAWVKIVGMPLHLCDSDVYAGVAALFGKVVKPFFVYPSMVDWSRGVAGILVKSDGFINGEVSVLWQDNTTRIWGVYPHISYLHM